MEALSIELPNEAPQFKDSTAAKYAAVKDEFNKMVNKKENGKQIYSYEYIFETVARKFFYSAKTVENIVFDRVAPGRHQKKVKDGN